MRLTRAVPGAAVVAAALAVAAAGALDHPPEVARITPPAPHLAYLTRVPGLQGLAGLDARAGLALFDRPWAAAPASTRASDGLGPLYAARACAACHVNHGRAHPADEAAPVPVGMVMRLAQPDGAPDPVLGAQVQPLATGGLPGEARVGLTWAHHTVVLADGTAVDLRRPVVTLTDTRWGAPDPATTAGPRAAPPLVGLGLIAAIAAADILAGADPDDRDGDGIRGRARLVAGQGGDPVPGRFGRRAGEATLDQAVALALSVDMGLSSPLFPDPWGDCTAAQAACRAAPHGDGDVRGHEVSAQAVALIAGHLASLAVPAPAAAPEARGAALFDAAGCAACHRPAFPIATTDGPREIRAYSDFLLHDLGPGMASPVAEPGVAPGEWRTAPLWGIGHARAVGMGRESWLHDGRARSLLEAILWHGGTATPARDRVAAMDADDRAALIRYLEGL